MLRSYRNRWLWELLFCVVVSAVFYRVAGAETPQPTDTGESNHPDDEVVVLSPHTDAGFAFRTREGRVVPVDKFFDRYANSLHLGADDEMRPLPRNASKTPSDRYQRYYRGLPVLGAEYLLHVVGGNVVSGQGAVFDIGGPDIVPRVRESDAVRAALLAVAARVDDGISADILASAPVDVSLALAPETTPGHSRLVYETRVMLAHASYVVLVDATTGDVLSLSQGALGSQNNVVYQSLSTRYDGLVDITLVEDLHGSPPVTDTVVGVIANSPNGVYSPASATVWCAPDEVDAHWQIYFYAGPAAAQMDPRCDMPMALNTQWLVEQSMAFFDANFGWKGMDGSGLAMMQSFLHFEMSPDLMNQRAYYQHLPTVDEIHLRGFTFQAPGVPLFSPTTQAETVGHEFVHGISNYAVGAAGPCVDAYATEWIESRIREEAFADVLGLATLNWRRVMNGQSYLRSPSSEPDGVTDDFANPNATFSPDTYGGFLWLSIPDTCAAYEAFSIDHRAEVLGSDSAIIRRWYDLLAFNGPSSGVNDNHEAYNVQGLDAAKATIIVFKTLVDELTSDMGFVQTRAATINATESIAAANGQLYPFQSVGTISTMNAWHAVGIGNNADLTLEEMGAIKVSPKNGAANVPPWTWNGAQATLSRDALHGQAEKSVTFIVSQDPTFQTRTVSRKNDAQSDGIFGKRTFYLHLNLSPGRKYYWKSVVDEADHAGCAALHITEKDCAKIAGDWSAVRSFTTGDAMTSWIPSNDRDYPWDSHLTWNPVSGALGYDLMCSTNSVFDEAQDPYVFHEPVPLTNNNVGVQEAYMPMLVDENEFCLVRASGPTDETLLEEIANDPDPYGNYGSWSGDDTPIQFHTKIPEAKLISPEDGKHVFWTTTLAWEPVEGAQGYSFQLSETPDFLPGQFFEEYKQGNQTTTHTVEYDSISDEGIRYWRVIPVGPAVGGYPFGQEGGEGEIWTFVVDFKATAPNPISPVDIDIDAYESATSFEWSDVPGATNYQVKVYSLDETKIYESDLGLAHTASINGVSDPYVGKKGFCWTIQARKGTAGGQLSKACYGLGPDAPFQIQPQFGETGVGHSDNNPTFFAWNSRYAPYGYRLQWGKEGEAEIEADVSIRPPEKKVPLAPGVLAPLASYEAGAAFGLKASTWYRWRVFAEKKDGSEQWNGVWFRFMTDNETNDEPGSGDGGSGSGGGGGSCSAMPKPKILCPKGLGQDPHGNEYDFSFYTFNTNNPGYVLKWGAVSGASTYDVEVEKMTYPYDAPHTTTIASQTVQAGSSSGTMSAGPFMHPAQSIAEANTPAELVLYRWVVRAVNGCGEAGDFASSKGYPSLVDPSNSSQTIQMCQ